MLQSRLRGAIFGRRSRLGVNRGISKRFLSQEQEIDQSAATQGTAPTQGYAPLPTGLPADPAIHSSDPPQVQYFFLISSFNFLVISTIIFHQFFIHLCGNNCFIVYIQLINLVKYCVCLMFYLMAIVNGRLRGTW